jgi:Family of unknown function (DUF5924)
MSKPNLKIARRAPAYRFSFIGWCRRHQEKLWWLHSLYALMLGIGVMWLGKRNFAYVRVAVIHLSFIWLSTLILPKLLNHPRLSQRWASRLQLVVNFFNKNFYQQMLFFVLPIYYASTTLSSLNVVFGMLVGLSALLSTLDLIYDRHLSVRRNLAAGFFAFNLFALINVMLPILWSVSNTQTTRISGVLAFAGFLSLAYPASQSIIRRLARVFGIGFIILGVVELGRAFIPPAPLRLVSAEFGTDFDRDSWQMISPLTKLNSAGPLRLDGVTAIKAPLGLKERLQHRWYENGNPVCTSPFYNVVGGREEGFRLWTGCAFSNIPPNAELRLDVETEGGQLVGRAKLKAGS